MTTRFFVQIIAKNKQQLMDLQKFELDLFQSTGKSIEDRKFSIDGLITLEDVNKLVQNGYRVMVKKESMKRTPALDEIMSFEEWSEVVKKGEKEEKEEGLREAKPEKAPTFKGYLTSKGIHSALQYLAKIYPSIVQLISLPEKTYEGYMSKAIKIGVKNATPKNGILFLGGVHAREILNPDLLVKLALDLCQAYTTNNGLTFGGKSFTPENVKQIVDNLELFVFPLVNPDGRSFVQAPNGDVWWRKNRNPNPGLEQKGVDLNRNYDFLWESGIGTSTNSITEIYKGKEPASEKETKNVLHLINKYKNISCVFDVHSYSEVILYPWGDDDIQTEDPDMNFVNSDYDGSRGIPGDSIYKEYIHKKDLDWYESTGKRRRNAIAAVQGTVYEAQQSIGLYPTSGTCDDYIYSLRYNGANREIKGFTIETAKLFQPTYEDAIKVMSEVSAGLVEACKIHLE
ncbi:MAG: M14 family zinc carboxypeptidase [Nitrososphaeraceae archaeon]